MTTSDFGTVRVEPEVFTRSVSLLTASTVPLMRFVLPFTAVGMLTLSPLRALCLPGLDL